MNAPLSEPDRHLVPAPVDTVHDARPGTRHATRRAVLGAGAAGLAGLGVAGPADALGHGRRKKTRKPKITTTVFPHVSFEHGVASGDPLPSAVVIWTRVTPGPTATPGSGIGPKVDGRWEVATDPGFTTIVKTGDFTTTTGRDHTVKADVTGLAPEAWYFYRFAVAASETTTKIRRHRHHRGGKQNKKRGKRRPKITRTFTYTYSPTGRTRTAPAPTSSPANLRFGVVSCANLQAGFFSAYRGLAARDDLHAIVFLGDYLYEYGPGQYGYGNADVDIRSHVPAHEMISLPDYRQRHAQYKQDPDLQALHAKYPWVLTWDDHEVANDAYDGGAENHDPATEGDFFTRRIWAHRAYDEWMPVRMSDTAEVGDGTRLYRRFQFGTLLELSMLDLRTYRSKQVANMAASSEIADPARSITGDAQMAWLKDGLSRKAAQWKIVGNPVMISPVDFGALPADVVNPVNDVTGLLPSQGAPYNVDQWDGYTADRRELFAHLRDQGIKDALFITGDIHSGWAAELPIDASTYPASGTVGVEFVGTSVTSNNLKDILNAPPHTASRSVEQAFLANNRHIKYLNFDDHGFSILDVTSARAQMDWYIIGDRADKNTAITWTQSWLTRADTSRIEQVSAPVA